MQWLSFKRVIKISQEVLIVDNKLIKNAYIGKRCFIVATGPSLAYKNISFLKNELVIALNLAIITLDKFDIEPAFNIISDKYQYINFHEVFKKLTYNREVKKIVVGSACDTFPNELIDKNTHFFPKKLQQEKADFSKNPISDGFARGKTVAFDAIQLAYYLGFKEVFIIGMDMKLDNEWGINGHCYEIHKNNKFLDLKYPNKESLEINRGPPGHPEYLTLINDCMLLAKKAFQEEGRLLINDSRSRIETLYKRDILKEFGTVKKVIAFVPAKGTSSRIPEKNIRILGNKPLFLHVLDTLLSCYTIDEVYLDSDSEKIFELAKDRKMKKLKRDPALSTNKTDGNQLLLNEASNVDADIYIQALPTAPFLSQKTIDDAVFNLITSAEKDSLFTVHREKLYLWSDNEMPLNYDPRKIPNSVELKETIIETMGLYVIRKESLLLGKSRIGKNPILYDIPLLETIDINTPENFELASLIVQGMGAIRNEKY